MKNTTLSLFTLLFVFFSYSQCPTEDIILLSQAEIDNFAINYPNCSVLTHELKIDGENSDITNLNGLSSITNAQDVFIVQTQINEFSGLSNLVTSSSLSLWFNQNIQNLEGLVSLEVLGGLEMFVNNNLTSLFGVGSLQSLDNLSLFDNSNLSDISQLSFLETINFLNISGNSLNNLSGLENLHTIQEDLIISESSIQDLNEIGNLQTIGGSLYILSNNQIQNLTAFNNIESLVNLFIIDCPNLLDTYALENLHTVTGKLRIGVNPSLSTMNIFKNIVSVGDLDIYQNTNLISLKGLEYLQEINQRLLINDNPILNNIIGISNVMPSSVDKVIIVSNPILSICNNPFICGIIDDSNVNKIIQNNAIGCDSAEEVEESCLLLGMGENVLLNKIMVFPNPVSEMLTISFSGNLSLKKAVVYSVLGKKLLETSGQNIDVYNLASGVYFVEINTDKGNIIKRIVKE